MYNCLYYWIFAPMKWGIEDSPNRRPVFALEVISDGGEPFEFGLYCSRGGVPQFARCRIPGLSTKAIPETALPVLQALKEHLLTTMRLTYSADTVLGVPSTVWTFIEQGKPERFGLKVRKIGSLSFSVERTRSLFLHSFEHRELMRLFVDGGDPRIPLQYQFLSLYKLLELRFRRRGRWDRKGLDALLERYRDRFKAEGFHGNPATEMHGLRNRCAHIRTGTRDGPEALGVTHLNLAEAARVERMLPVLRMTCASVINETAGGKFYVETERVT